MAGCSGHSSLIKKEKPMTQGSLQEQVIARAMKDASFRQELLSNPAEVLAREYQVHLPAYVAVRVLEEAPNTLTLVLPAREEAVEELSDAELQGASGRGYAKTGHFSWCLLECPPPCSVRLN
jgi:hypothetical protein